MVKMRRAYELENRIKRNQLRDSERKKEEAPVYPRYRHEIMRQSGEQPSRAPSPMTSMPKTVTWKGPFEGETIREFHKEIYVGFGLRNNLRALWVDGQVWLVHEVVDFVPLGRRHMKYKVRTDQGLFIISRREDKWVLEKEVTQ